MVFETMIHSLGELQGNRIFIKREDFIPLSFGGNKARKAQLFFEEIDNGGYDCVVTYGSSSSNHCRVVANMAASRGIECIIISPEEASVETFNSKMMSLFGANIVVVPVEKVSTTIDDVLLQLENYGKKTYFIAGGGHGNIGTQAYVDCYEEIRRFESANNVHFDYIFHASGTGTTQAGLVCGQLIHRDDRKIIGISIARRNPRGRDVILASINEYLNSSGVILNSDVIDDAAVFVDKYVGNGYGCEYEEVEQTIDSIMMRFGIPLDSTYTGKAFYGMLDYLKSESINGKNVLFIHTGGTPLFFDHLNNIF